MIQNKMTPSWWTIFALMSTWSPDAHVTVASGAMMSESYQITEIDQCHAVYNLHKFLHKYTIAYVAIHVKREKV